MKEHPLSTAGMQTRALCGTLPMETVVGSDYPHSLKGPYMSLFAFLLSFLLGNAPIGLSDVGGMPAGSAFVQPADVGGMPAGHAVTTMDVGGMPAGK